MTTLRQICSQEAGDGGRSVRCVSVDAKPGVQLSLFYTQNNKQMKSTIKVSAMACAAALAMASCGGGGGSSLATGDVYVPFKAQSGDRFGMMSTEQSIVLSTLCLTLSGYRIMKGTQ